MPTDLTQGRKKVCKDQLGGNSILYLFTFLKDAFTVDGTGEATALNLALTEVFAYELEGDNNTLVENMVSDRNTGTTVNTQTVSIQLKKVDAATSAEMNLLAKCYPQAVVKDRNGTYHALGIDDGMDFTVDQATGGAKTDFNGYTLTGIATTKGLSPKLDAMTSESFIALAAPVV